MHSPALTFFLALLAAATVNAHFQLQFPPPRGVFVEDKEPGFCDGYLNSVSNRSEFPLSGGFFSLNSEHPSWTAGVLISTLDNPQTFNNFSQVNTFFQVQGEGAFCIPLDLSKSNATSLLTSGQNATIQIVYSGGDGQLYQCADVILSNNFSIPSSVACTNATGSSSTSTPGATTTSPASGASPTTTNSFALPKYTTSTSAIALVLAVFGLILV